jgi:hypothetical protein
MRRRFFSICDNPAACGGEHPPEHCRGRANRLNGAHAPVAQLDRALPSEGKGHTFESCRVRHRCLRRRRSRARKLGADPSPVIPRCAIAHLRMRLQSAMADLGRRPGIHIYRLRVRAGARPGMTSVDGRPPREAVPRRSLELRIRRLGRSCRDAPEGQPEFSRLRRSCESSRP